MPGFGRGEVLVLVGRPRQRQRWQHFLACREYFYALCLIMQGGVSVNLRKEATSGPVHFFPRARPPVRHCPPAPPSRAYLTDQHKRLLCFRIRFTALMLNHFNPPYTGSSPTQAHTGLDISQSSRRQHQDHHRHRTNLKPCPVAAAGAAAIDKSHIPATRDRSIRIVLAGEEARSRKTAIIQKMTEAGVEPARWAGACLVHLVRWKRTRPRRWQEKGRMIRM